MVKPKLGIRKQDDQQFLAAVTAVKNAMTLNAVQFPGSAATLALLVTALTAYATALQAAVDGKISQQALVDAKDATRAAVEELLRTLADQVRAVANGDINVIHDAGMQATNEPTPASMPQVLDLRVTPSENDGELVAKWAPVGRGLRCYQVEVCLDTASPPTSWHPKKTCTKTSCRLNDTLVSGQKVWVRVRAVGSNGDGPWSDPAWKTVP